MSCNTISRNDVTIEEMLICSHSKTIPGSRTDPRVIIIAEGEFDCAASHTGLLRRDGSPAPEGDGEKVSQKSLGELPLRRGPLCAAAASLAPLSEPSMPASASAS